nr:hypothetical protein [Candidatus Cloacimonadota bacterium]
MKSLKYICIYILIGWIPFSNLSAQKEKKGNLVSLMLTVVNEKNNPVKNARIYSNEGKYIAYTDVSGNATVTSNNTDEILIEADGFESTAIPVSSLGNGSKVT